MYTQSFIAPFHPSLPFLPFFLWQDACEALQAEPGRSDKLLLVLTSSKYITRYSNVLEKVKKQKEMRERLANEQKSTFLFRNVASKNYLITKKQKMVIRAKAKINGIIGQEDKNLYWKIVFVS